MTALRYSHSLAKSPARSGLPDEDWRDRALCRADPEMFFADGVDAIRRAKAACRGCPVTDDCDSEARRVRPTDGVWAGKLWVGGRPVNRDTRRESASDPELPPCGTEQGYQSHRYRKTAYCDPCKAAHAATVREQGRARLRRDVTNTLAILQDVARGAA